MNALFPFELPLLLLGLIFGSFLNVCISRLPAHESLWRPRSHCPHCGQNLRWYDNVPLLSYLLLRGRCRNCKRPISWRYPAVELALGLWLGFIGWLLQSFDGYYLQPQSLPHILALALTGFLLLGLMVTDWQTHRLPDALTVTGMIAGFLLLCWQASYVPTDVDAVLLHGRNPLSSPGAVVDSGNVVLTGPEHVVLGRLLAMTCAGGLLLTVRWLYKLLRHREGLGLGDAKLLAMIAALLGFAPAMVALVVGVLLCAAWAVVLLATRRATAASRLPLGSFLCAGGLVAASYGPTLLAWYRGLF